MFSGEVWELTERLTEATLAHPFNRELSAGTLAVERFRFYLVQDAKYLAEFARTLAAAAALADDPDDAAFLAGSSANVLTVERGLHERYFAEFGLTPDAVAAIETSPTGAAYTNHLLATAQRGSYPEVVAALLPCFWIYEYVGRAIHAEQLGQAGASGNPYRAWIETYADDAFTESVARMREITDRAAKRASADVRRRMVEAYVRAAEYEWLFWDSGYHQESWPTAPFRATAVAMPEGSPGISATRAAGDHTPV